MTRGIWILTSCQAVGYSCVTQNTRETLIFSLSVLNREAINSARATTKHYYSRAPSYQHPVSIRHQAQHLCAIILPSDFNQPSPCYGLFVWGSAMLPGLCHSPPFSVKKMWPDIHSFNNQPLWTHLLGPLSVTINGIFWSHTFFQSLVCC